MDTAACLERLTGPALARLGCERREAAVDVWLSAVAVRARAVLADGVERAGHQLGELCATVIEAVDAARPELTALEDGVEQVTRNEHLHARFHGHRQCSSLPRVLAELNPALDCGRCDESGFLVPVLEQGLYVCLVALTEMGEEAALE